MRIYLASRYSRIDEMNKHATELRSIGYTVDARWLNGNHQLHEGAEEVENNPGSITQKAMLFAQDDLDDLIASNMVICFTEISYSQDSVSRGGRHVELGLALMWNYKSILSLQKQILLVGPRENVFYCLPNIKQFTTWEDCIKHLIHKI